jgi:hypothetical protein
VLRSLPGRAVGAPGAITGGEKLLPPVGLMPFSVGDGDGATDEVVVVVVVLDGLGFSPPPQPAVSATIVMIAAPPAMTGRRRARRSDFMVLSYLIPG